MRGDSGLEVPGAAAWLNSALISLSGIELYGAKSITANAAAVRSVFDSFTVAEHCAGPRPEFTQFPIAPRLSARRLSAAAAARVVASDAPVGVGVSCAAAFENVDLASVRTPLMSVIVDADSAAP